jgi:hypothetical protein
MTDEINEMWSKDCKIDEANIVGEAKRIPELHSKYYNLFFKEALRVRKLKADMKELEKAKYEYYSGSMCEEDLRERGWKPNPLKILRNDIDRYMQSDKDVIQLSLKIALHEERANYLENIIRQINNRNFVIKSMIDMIKFQAGEF